MAHNTRIQIDTFYACAVVLPQEFWRSLDNAQVTLVNGDGGGTWAPAAAINILGAGLWICSTSTSAGTIINAVASGARITHGDNDYIQLQTGHTGAARSLVTAVSEGADVSGGTAVLTTITGNGLSTDAGLGNGTSRPGARVTIPLRVHDGATMTQVVFSFTVTNLHAGVPVSLPLFRVYKVDASGNVTPLKSGTTIAAGFVMFNPTPANAGAWIVGGAVQNFTYTLDASVVIDRANFLYFAEIVDEAGANAKAGNNYETVSASFTLIPDLRPQ